MNLKNTTKNAIELKNIYKYYANFNAIHNLNLVIEEGSIFGLLGPNGAGKTSVVKIILGLSPNFQGECLLFEKKNQVQLREHIGYLPERISIHPFLNPIEFLKISGKMLGMNNIAIQKKTKEVLKKVGLEDVVDHKIKTFSKGMLQRLGFAQAILHEPKLLILDEPGSGLDPKGLIEMRELIVHENRIHGTTIFLNSHRLSEVEKICHSVGILDHGVLKARGTLDELRQGKEKIQIVLEENIQQELKEYFQSIAKRISIQSNQIELELLDSQLVKNLPKEIVERGGEIRKYEKLKENLEEVFLRTIQTGETNGKSN